VEYILQKAEEAGKEVYKKAREVIEEGKARRSLTLKGFERGRSGRQKTRGEGDRRRCRD
jgi:hypothetical protein